MATNSGLRETLQLMPTAKLDAMLRGELHKNQPDTAAVNLILDILKERETEDTVVLTQEIREAWEKYRNYPDSSCSRNLTSIRSSCLLRVASIILVLGLLLFALPQQVGAKSLWDRFIYITDSILELFDPSGVNDHHVEYRFETDNPGLQLVYNAAVELGITDPVVPMWIPDGFELVEFWKETTTPTKNKVHAEFKLSDQSIILKIEYYNILATHDYFKDETGFTQIEYDGITHNVLRNNDLWVVVWMRDSIECSLSIECQEDILYKILKSIYVTEVE